MEALHAHVPLPECLVIGDSKLLSATVIERLWRQQLHFLAPLPKSAALDTAFFALDPEGWQSLDYLAKRQERLAPEERTQYQGQEVAWEWLNPETSEIERFRRLFVTSNARMAALVLLLHLALMVYCLLEREARRQLAAKGRQKVTNLLAGHVDAVPTGENILRAFEHVFLIIEAGEHGQEYAMSEFSPEQAELWRLLGIQEPVWT